ncbi:MAG: acyl--CoA ligase [Desulfatibacillum sp.]|nr:acyl--CoA ligase [Desulfatibacillum sp.]
MTISPDDPAYYFYGREITFKEMGDLSDRLACGFLKDGIRRGDRIGIIALNQPEWMVAFFAAARIGASVVGLSPRHPAPELLRLIQKSRPKAIVSLKNIGDTDYAALFENNREKLPGLTFQYFIGGEGFKGSKSLESLMEDEVDQDLLSEAMARVEPEDEIMFAFTSGTTGQPKAAAITHKSMIAAARAQTNHIRVTSKDILLLTSPFSHVGGITIGMASMLLARAATILIPVFLPEEVLSQAAEHHPTILGGFPTMHHMLMAHEGFERMETSSLRVVITGGSNAEPDLVERLHQAYPDSTIMNLYGLSESSGGAIMTPWNCHYTNVGQTIGKPLPGFDVKIVGMDGRESPVNETGEIWLKGNCVVTGYFDMPEETFKTFDQNGWLRTGDMAYKDEEGFIILMGRRTEMYIQEGLNVFPVEVEDILSTHPSVDMVAGIGIPDPVYGEVGRYYVVPSPGSATSEDELRSFCIQSLADYKVPKQIVFRQDLPMTALGKIKKSDLRREFENTGK